MAPVFVDKDRKTLTRKDLVLIAANQDGGAHVDPALDDRYDRLSKRNAMGLIAIEKGQARAMEGPERAAIRQMAHEVLKTLKPGYEKKPSHEAGIFAGGMSIVAGAPPAGMPKVAGMKKTGRNERCPCGSGKKFKHCCGQLAR